MFIVKNKQAVASIKRGKATEFAAHELRDYVNKISGATLPILPEGEDARGALIEFRVHDNLPAGAFHLRSAGDLLLISGYSKLEVLQAVYWLLEEYAGCFWAAPGEDDIPETPTLEIPDLDIIKKSDTPVRGMQLHRYSWMQAENDDLPVIDWMTKRRMNFALLSHFEIDAHRKDVTIAALKERGIEFLFGLHTFNYWLAPAKYFDRQPELFAMRGGVRLNPAENVGVQICMTNPDAIAICARNIIKYLEENPDSGIIGLGANDGPAGWCECPDCERLEPMRFSPIQSRVFSTRVKSLTYATFCNRVVEKVAERFPDQRFAALFYTNTLAPPDAPDFRLHPNIDAVPALFERYYDRPLAVGVTEQDYRTMPPDKMLEERYTRYPAMLKRWREIVQGRIYFHAYFMGTNGSINLPFPFYHTIAEDFRLFRELGLDGFYTQGGVPDFGSYGLNFYLAAESSYDTGKTADTVIADYCKKFYGPASEPMTAYYRLLQQMACARHNNNASILLLETFDRQTPQLKEYLDQAHEAAQPDGKYTRRVAQATVTLRYALLCKQYRLGWLKMRVLLQKKDMPGLQLEYDRLQELETRILDLAESDMLGKGLMHFRDRPAVENYVLGSLRRGTCTEKMAGNIDFDIPWDVE